MHPCDAWADPVPCTSSLQALQGPDPDSHTSPALRQQQAVPGGRQAPADQPAAARQGPADRPAGLERRALCHHRMDVRPGEALPPPLAQDGRGAGAVPRPLSVPHDPGGPHKARRRVRSGEGERSKPWQTNPSQGGRPDRQVSSLPDPSPLSKLEPRSPSSPANLPFPFSSSSSGPGAAAVPRDRQPRPSHHPLLHPLPALPAGLGLLRGSPPGPAWPRGGHRPAGRGDAGRLLGEGCGAAADLAERAQRAHPGEGTCYPPPPWHGSSRFGAS